MHLSTYIKRLYNRSVTVVEVKCEHYLGGEIGINLTGEVGIHVLCRVN